MHGAVGGGQRLHEVAHPVGDGSQLEERHGAGGLGQGVHVLADEGGVAEGGKGHGRSDFYHPLADLDPLQAGDARDIHQAARSKLALAEVEHQVRAPRNDPSRPLVPIQHP